MENHNKRWTEKDVRSMKIMRENGASTHVIAEYLGRTKGAVDFKVHELKLTRQPKTRPDAKYTRYMKPKSEISLLWGLVKITKP